MRNFSGAGPNPDGLRLNVDRELNDPDLPDLLQEESTSDVDYESFDNDAKDTCDEEYVAFVEWLSEQTSAQLRAAKGDTVAQREALCRYYSRGLRANVTTDELIDFLAVSTPSILDTAGYNETEADALMQLSDSLTGDEINCEPML